MNEMSKTILANVDGFTPVIDTLVDELGLMSAAVFGRIWRYCQMEDGVCRASLESIAKWIGVDKATVMRHAKVLCENGYLKDLTPDLRNRPHVYADTGKAGISIQISGVAHSKAKKGTVAENNATVAQRNVTVAESQLNKDSKRDSNKPSAASLEEIKEAANKKVDAYLLLMRSPGLKNSARVDAILSYLGGRFQINTETKRWKEFAKFVDDRQQRFGQSVETFVNWLMGQKDFDIKYWSPQRMTEMYPQAFSTQSQPDYTPRSHKL